MPISAQSTEWFCVINRLVNGIHPQTECEYVPGFTAEQAINNAKSRFFGSNI